METIKLDLIPGKKMPSLHASQYDDGREHGIDLFENGVAYKLDGTETLTINERKVDNNICSMDIENTFEGSSHIEFASFLQMCACAGSNFCELRISKDGVDIGTLNFILEVEPDPTADGIESESEIRNLKTQVEAITEEVIGDDYYTKTQTDEAIANATEGKADTTYVDTELAKKADKTDTYTKTQVDNALNNKMNKANPTGTGSLAVGTGVVANGTTSQAFGYNTTASGTASTALGNTTTASGNQSISEGNRTVASGDSAHASGRYTISNHRSQKVFGEWNKEDNSSASATMRGNYIEIVGNGTSESNRSNARTLDWQGNETLAGDLTYNGNKSLTSEISRLDGKIDNLPAPMIFKGTLGVGGTIQTLPTASASNEGFTYKVITDGTYAGQTAKVGDVFTSNGSSWVYIPSGDEDNDTWRAIKVNGVEKLGNGISSGAVDFVGSDNIEVDFDSNGNKVGIKTKNIYTQEQVDTIVSDAIYNILPSELTPTGAVANFSTALELPVKYEVENAASIVSQLGANLWDEETLVGGYNISDGAFNPSLTGRLCSKNMIKVQPNSSVYWHSLANVSTGNIFFYDVNKQYLNGYTGMGNSVINIPNNCYYMNFTLPTAYGTTYNHDVSVNCPSEDTDYHAYSKTDYPITDHSDLPVIVAKNGANNLYADVGDISVEYKVSIEQYVSNHSGGGGAKSLGGVYLGGSNSGSEEEPTEESEEPKEETKEVTKTLGDEPISKK